MKNDMISRISSSDVGFVSLSLSASIWYYLSFCCAVVWNNNAVTNCRHSIAPARCLTSAWPGQIHGFGMPDLWIWHARFMHLACQIQGSGMLDPDAWFGMSDAWSSIPNPEFGMSDPESDVPYPWIWPTWLIHLFFKSPKPSKLEVQHLSNRVFF